MNPRGVDLSEYRTVWLLAMFDLPVTTKAARREYAGFRKRLIAMGFTMLQFSVYARFCRSADAAEQIRGDIRAVLPDEGQVRVVSITDRQFAKMEVFFGTKRRPTEDPPAQIMLF